MLRAAEGSSLASSARSSLHLKLSITDSGEVAQALLPVQEIMAGTAI